MNNHTAQFNLTANLNLDDEFDPLEDNEPDEEDDDAGEYIASVGTSTGSNNHNEALGKPDIRSAEERLAELLTQMAPRRKVLFGIMDFCREPQLIASVNNLVEQLQENNFSVYSAANLCALLEKSGALKRQTADGEEASDIESEEPELVEIDGVEYLEAKAPLELYWFTTETGIAAVEADKPLDRFMDLLEEDELYKPLYKRILTLCSVEGGATTAALSAAIDNDPLVQKPRLYASHFIDKLEKCDALTWTKAWSITNIGEVGLKTLENTVDTAEIIETKEA